MTMPEALPTPVEVKLPADVEAAIKTAEEISKMNLSGVAWQPDIRSTNTAVKKEDIPLSEADERYLVLGDEPDEDIPLSTFIENNLLIYARQLPKERLETLKKQGILTDKEGRTVLADNVGAKEKIALLKAIVDQIATTKSLEPFKTPGIDGNVWLTGLQATALHLAEKTYDEHEPQSTPDTSQEITRRRLKKPVVEDRFKMSVAYTPDWEIRGRKPQRLSELALAAERAMIFKVSGNEATDDQGKKVTFKSLREQAIQGNFDEAAKTRDSFSHALENNLKKTEMLRNLKRVIAARLSSKEMATAPEGPELHALLGKLSAALNSRKTGADFNSEDFETALKILFPFEKQIPGLSSQNQDERLKNSREFINNFYEMSAIIFGTDKLVDNVEIDLREAVGLQEILLTPEARLKRLQLEEEVHRARGKIWEKPADNVEPKLHDVLTKLATSEYEQALKKLGEEKQKQRAAILIAFDVKFKDGTSVIKAEDQTSEFNQLVQNIKQRYESLTASEQLGVLDINRRMILEMLKTKGINLTEEQINTLNNRLSEQGFKGKTTDILQELGIDEKTPDYETIRDIIADGHRVTGSLVVLGQRIKDDFTPVENLTLSDNYFAMGLKGTKYLYDHSQLKREETKETITIPGKPGEKPMLIIPGEVPTYKAETTQMPQAQETLPVPEAEETQPSSGADRVSRELDELSGEEDMKPPSVWAPKDVDEFEEKIRAPQLEPAMPEEEKAQKAMEKAQLVELEINRRDLEKQQAEMQKAREDARAMLSEEIQTDPDLEHLKEELKKGEKSAARLIVEHKAAVFPSFKTPASARTEIKTFSSEQFRDNYGVSPGEGETFEEVMPEIIDHLSAAEAEFQLREKLWKDLGLSEGTPGDVDRLNEAQNLPENQRILEAMTEDFREAFEAIEAEARLAVPTEHTAEQLQAEQKANEIIQEELKRLKIKPEEGKTAAQQLYEHYNPKEPKDARTAEGSIHNVTGALLLSRSSREDYEKTYGFDAPAEDALDREATVRKHVALNIARRLMEDEFTAEIDSAIERAVEEQTNQTFPPEYRKPVRPSDGNWEKFLFITNGDDPDFDDDRKTYQAMFADHKSDLGPAIRERVFNEMLGKDNNQLVYDTLREKLQEAFAEAEQVITPPIVEMSVEQIRTALADGIITQEAVQVELGRLTEGKDIPAFLSTLNRTRAKELERLLREQAATTEKIPGFLQPATPPPTESPPPVHEAAANLELKTKLKSGEGRREGMVITCGELAQITIDKKVQLTDDQIYLYQIVAEGWIHQKGNSFTVIEINQKDVTVNENAVNHTDKARGVYSVTGQGSLGITEARPSNKVSLYEDASFYLGQNTYPDQPSTLTINSARPLFFTPESPVKTKINYDLGASEDQVFITPQLPLTAEAARTAGHQVVKVGESKDQRTFVVMVGKNNTDEKALAVFEEITFKVGDQSPEKRLIFIDGRRTEDKEHLKERLEAKTGLEDLSELSEAFSVLTAAESKETLRGQLDIPSPFTTVGRLSDDEQPPEVKDAAQSQTAPSGKQGVRALIEKAGQTRFGRAVRSRLSKKLPSPSPLPHINEPIA